MTRINSTDDKLAISMKAACHMLDVEINKIYDLLKAGEIRSYVDGGIRKIDLASLRAYHEKKLQASTEFKPREPQGAL